MKQNEDDDYVKDCVRRFEESLSKNRDTFFDVDDFVDIIDYYLECLDLSKAGLAVEKALEQYPQELDVEVKYCQILAIQGKVSEAIFLLKKNLEIDPNDPDVLTALAFFSGVLADQNPDDSNLRQEALDLYQKALTILEHPEDIYFDVAAEYAKAGMYDKSIYYMQMLIQSDPAEDMAFLSLALYYRDAESLEDGLQFFSEYLEREPYIAGAWNAYSVCLSAGNQMDKAIEACEYALAISFDNKMFKNNLAAIYREKGDLAKTVELLEELVVESPEDLPTLKSLAESYLFMEDFPNAMKRFLQIDTIYPGIAHVTHSLGICAYEMGLLKDALKYLKESLAEDPDRPEVWYLYACCQFECNKEKQGIAALKKSLKLSTEQGFMLLKIVWSMSQYNLQDFVIKYVIKRIKEIPDDWELHLALAGLYFQSERFLEADEELEICLDLGAGIDNLRAVLNFMHPELLELLNKK